MSLVNQKVLSVRFITKETYVLKTTRPYEDIVPGQCFSVGTADIGINREYSIFSGVHDDYLEFLVRRIPGGLVSERLSQLVVGEELQIGGPYGSFTLPEDNQGTDYVFIASGTGIAPFVSFVRSFPCLDYKAFHGVRYVEENYGRDYLDPLRCKLAVTMPSSGLGGKRVTDLLDSELLSKDSKYYLCGNRNMITDVVKGLRLKSIPGGQIYMETFF